MKKMVFSDNDASVPPYLGTIEDHGNYFLVHLKGSMDMKSLEANRSKMTAVIKKFDLYSKNLLCSFQKVTRTDTATVAALISRLSDFGVKKSNQLIFFNIPDELKTYMEVTKVLPYFRVCGTLEDALKAIADHV